MIKTIAHISDLHIRKAPTRNDEYEKVFNNLIHSLKQKKPDKIVITGDLVHDYLDLQGEQLIMASDLLNNLSEIAEVIITRGNHDYRRKNINRVDSVKAIVKTLHNKNVKYLDKTGVYYDENVAWMVWHHGEIKNNPWKGKDAKNIDKDEFTTIDLFHDPINGCKSDSGLEMKSKSYYRLSDFKGDYSLLGDIHKKQYLNKEKTKAYAGSLIAQKFDEGDDDFHGYLLWDIVDGTVEEIKIKNSLLAFKNVKISPYIDFDDLDFEIHNPSKSMKIRFIWNTLPQSRTNENERKLVEYVKSTHKNVLFSHKNEFIENDKIEVGEDVALKDLVDLGKQQEFFTKFLERIGTDKSVIDEVINIDNEINKRIDTDETENIEWEIVSLAGENFMSYEDLKINWGEHEGLFQILGQNTAGKTTILKLLTYVLFGKTLETETKIKRGDIRYVNNRNGADFCDGSIIILANGEYYGINRHTQISKKMDGEINGVTTTLNYHKLISATDTFNDDNSLDNLNDDDRVQTQKKINNIIGTYENFKRIVLTTSDTLNKILSNDMSVFIDSLLADTGLDIFDRKLVSFKEYQKEVNSKNRITCNVQQTTDLSNKLKGEIQTIKEEIRLIQDEDIKELNESIKKGETFVEKIQRKIHPIDETISNLDVKETEKLIEDNNIEIIKLEDREKALELERDKLKDEYDVEKLKSLKTEKDEHKTKEAGRTVRIQKHKTLISNYEHDIEKVRGDIHRLKIDGGKLKETIVELRSSKVCIECGQDLDEVHQERIRNEIKTHESTMYGYADKIKEKNEEIVDTHQVKINTENNEITVIQAEIVEATLEMEETLISIGEIENDKNDFEKRKELVSELNSIPTQIENYTLKNTVHGNNIIEHNKLLDKIEENKKNSILLKRGKDKLETLGIDLDNKKDLITEKNLSIIGKNANILTNDNKIIEFEEQEKFDNVLGLYKKCVHRDGIPKQILSTHILPRINTSLAEILSTSQFKVWLDIDDLKPKLAYNDKSDIHIDCISASGKERTFSSIVLKFALNRINIKAKPSIFLLDEVMGKLDEESIDEFRELLDILKKYVKKLLIIEHRINLDPDHVINVELSDNRISSLTME